MWIAFYNELALGDVLLLTRGDGNKDALESLSQGNVTVIRDEDSQEVLSVNLFQVKEQLGLSGQGPISLTDSQVARINEMIQAAAFDLQIAYDASPRFVVGYVEECEKMADSDHLNITQTSLGTGESVQIVCGARNIQAGQHVIVAQVGAVLPNGAIIWEGELRGTPSYGMICSTRELGLTDIEDLPGIWEVDEKFPAGTPLAEVVAAYRA